MDWIVTLVVGGIVGWLASLVMKTNQQMGHHRQRDRGIVGSSLGFWLAGILGLAAYGSIARWAVAVVGAAVLIYILKALGLSSRGPPGPAAPLRSAGLEVLKRFLGLAADDERAVPFVGLVPTQDAEGGDSDALLLLGVK